MCSDIADLRGADTLQCVSFTFLIQMRVFGRWMTLSTGIIPTIHQSPGRIFFPLELLSLFNLVTGVELLSLFCLLTGVGNSCHRNTWAGQGWPGQSPVRAVSSLRKREACAAHCPAWLAATPQWCSTGCKRNSFREETRSASVARAALRPNLRLQLVSLPFLCKEGLPRSEPGRKRGTCISPPLLGKLSMVLHFWGRQGFGVIQVAKVVRNLPVNAGDARDVSIPGWGRSPGGRNGNPLQYSCLEKSMDWGVWRTTVHGVEKSWTCECTHGAFKETDKALRRAVPLRKQRNSQAVAPCASREAWEDEHLLSLDSADGWESESIETAPRLFFPFFGLFFKVFTEFVTLLFLFYLSVFWPQGTWGLSSLTRESNLHPSCWKVKSLQLDHQGSPSSLLPDLAEWILIHPVRFGLMPVVSLWRHIGWTTPMINLTFFFSIKKDAQPNVHSSRFIRPMRSIETQHVCVLLPNFLSTTRM